MQGAVTWEWSHLLKEKDGARDALITVQCLDKLNANFLDTVNHQVLQSPSFSVFQIRLFKAD